jgi:hypothetical protein
MENNNVVYKPIEGVCINIDKVRKNDTNEAVKIGTANRYS